MKKLSEHELAEICEFSEAGARMSYYNHAPRDFIEKTGLRAEPLLSFCITMIPQIDQPFFNRILGLGVREEATEAMLDQAIAAQRQAGNRSYMVHACPLARPSGISGWLKERGFVHGGSWVKLIRRDRPAPEMKTDLRVEKIDEKKAAAFAELIITIFQMPRELLPLMGGNIGRPDWFHYLAYDGDRPVSAAALYMQNGVGWLGFGSTLAEYRNRGAYGALTARRIRDGIEAGCRWLVSETAEETPEKPNPALHGLIRAGFEPAYIRPNYIFRQEMDRVS